MRALLRWAVAAALALASLTAPLPAAAQEGIGFWTAAAGGGGGNVSQTEEWVGFNDGTGTTVNAGASSKTITSLGATTANDWAGFCLYVSTANSSGNRYLLDVMDSGAHVIAANIYVEPGVAASGVPTEVCIPLNVAAGKTINIGLQGVGSGNSLKVAIKGLVRQASSPPLWNTFAALNYDLPNTRASTIDVLNHTTFGSSWTSVVSSNPATCGALLYIIGDNATGPAGGYVSTLRIAVTPNGGSLSEISRIIVGMAASGALYRNPVGIIYQSIPSLAAISADVVTPANGTDNHRVGIYCLS